MPVVFAQAFREVIMPDARYYVVGDREVWMVAFDNREYDSHSSHNEALLFAIEAAQKLGKCGESAHVCVVENDGRFRSKWRYDQDQVLRSTKSRIASKKNRHGACNWSGRGNRGVQVNEKEYCNRDRGHHPLARR